MSEKIKKALGQLDPANDDHWTSEGLPRLDIVKELVGEPVSRAEITSAAKSFTRKTLNLDEGEGLANEEQKKEDSANTSATPAKPPADTKAKKATVDEQVQGETELADLDLESDEAVEKRLDDAKVALAEAQSELLEAQAAMDVVINRRTAEVGQVSVAETIKAYQKSQNEQRAQAHERQKRMADAAKAMS